MSTPSFEPTSITHVHPSRRRPVLGLLSVIALTGALAVTIWLARGQTGDGVAAEPAVQATAATPAPDAAQPRSGPPSDGQIPTAPRGTGRGRGASDSATTGAPSADATATPTSVNAMRIVAVAGLHGADVFDQPGGIRLVTLPPGTRVTATGRDDRAAWLRVEDGAGGVGWTATAALVVFGSRDLPVVMTGALTPTPTAQANTPPVDDLPANIELVLIQNQDTGTYQLATATSPSRPPDATPTPAAAPVDSDITATVALDDARLNVRAGPGTDFTVIAKANPGDTFAVRGRDTTGAWLAVDLPDVDGGFGWIAAEFAGLSGPPDALPVADAVSSAPAFVASAAPASANSAPANITAAAGATGLTGTLVFQEHNGGTIDAFDLDTGRLTTLTHGFDPAVSPDGRTVAFTRDGGENGLYLIDITGGEARLIFSGRSDLRGPKWSPDGDWILFTRGDEYDECYDLGRMGCFTPEQFADRFPQLSPRNFPLVKEVEFNLAAVDPNGDNYHDIATLESAQAADWNQAGIVYQSDAGLQITSAAPDAVNRLLAFDYLKPFYRDPDWQPDGGQIVFQSQEGSHWEIFVVNPDGTGMTALTRPATALVDVLPSNVAPAWSPDGQFIAFFSNRDADHEAGAWRLWVMRADGSDQRPLDIPVDFDYTFANEQMVSWGP